MFAKRFWLALAATVLLSASLPAVPVSAATDPGKRVALVIGNGAYASAPGLGNPVADARAIAATLKRLGFQVVSGYDLNAAQMRTALADFSSSLPDSKAALVYYAGHGVSVDEENFLLPTDINLRNLTDLDLNAMSVSMILKQMRREERVNVVILDACRNNPFTEQLARGVKTRSIISERGLSRIDNELAKGSLIAFATDPKSTALDGPPGKNSPFTHALLNHLEDRETIDTVMTRVRTQVWEETKNKQMPWVNTSIIGEFYLNPKTEAVATVAPQPETPVVPDNRDERVDREHLLWASAERSNTPEDYKAYLDAYPQGAYAQMAKNRIARLSEDGDKAKNVAGDVGAAKDAVKDDGKNDSKDDVKGSVAAKPAPLVTPVSEPRRKQVRVARRDAEPDPEPRTRRIPVRVVEERPARKVAVAPAPVRAPRVARAPSRRYPSYQAYQSYPRYYQGGGYHYSSGHGGGAALGIIGGMAAGALLGLAIHH